MYSIIKNLHSWWAYLALIVLFLAVANSFLGFVSKKSFNSKDFRISLFALIFTHLQLLIGLVVYFVSPLGFGQLGEMKDKTIRLLSLEHPLTNLIAIALITIGWSRHKKAKPSGKFKTIFIFYGLGLFLILLRIPWKLWFS